MFGDGDDGGQLDGWIAWVMKRKDTMGERLFRVELRVDILDDETYTKFKKITLHTARTMMTDAGFVNQSPVRPQIAVILDDVFVGQKEIELFEDLMAPDEITPVELDETPVSAELISALGHSLQQQKGK